MGVPMIFDDLVAGEAVFLDTNTLLYHFAPDPALGAACTKLLIRIKRQEIQAYTSTHVVGEMAHRLMTLEAMQTQGWPAMGIGQRLRKHPGVIQKLTIFRQAIQEVPGFGIHVLSIPPDLLDAGAAASQVAGLLTNDGIIVAVMKANALTRIASNDPDFDRVAGITRYAPA